MDDSTILPKPDDNEATMKEVPDSRVQRSSLVETKLFNIHYRLVLPILKQLGYPTCA